MGKFYAVKVGKTPGIYLTWEDCKMQVDGFSGAEYKSFKTKTEAESYLNSKPETEDLYKDKLCAFVDGSFDAASGRYGSAAVLIKNGEIIETLQKCGEHPTIVSMRNVAGEITASVMAMRYALGSGYREIVIFHDYEGIAKWCTGQWKTEKEGTRLYKAFYNSVAERLKVEFVKVDAHSGVKYNEMADKLAKESLGI